MSDPARVTSAAHAPVAVEGLSIGWGNQPLIENISFAVDPGEVFAILGGSGAGKSTLLRCLVGLEPPLKGEIQIEGGGPPDLEHGLPPFGVMFQGGALFGSLTLLENVKLPLEQWTRLAARDVEELAYAKLRLVGLADAANRPPAELSGGMVKRAAIARALALDPKLVFFDEPSAGLDPVTSADLDDLILTLARTTQLTVVLVTHELESLFRIADRCLLLDRPSKSVLAMGDPRELRNSAHPGVHQFFNPGFAVKERSWRPVPPT
ncbi:ATP-binding cassette domain-containing protein [Myxococcaceae bacterium GXIMD 01537]